MYGVSRVCASITQVVQQSTQKLPAQALVQTTNSLKVSAKDTEKQSNPASMRDYHLPTLKPQILRSVLSSSMLTSYQNEIWQQRKGDANVEQACEKAFKSLKKQSKHFFKPLDMSIAIKQHLICEAALLCDNHFNSFTESEKTLSQSEKQIIAKNKQQAAKETKAMMADWLMIDQSSAGSSAINGELRTHIDKCKLDTNLECPPALKSELRQLISEKITQKQQIVVTKLLDSYLSKKPVYAADGEAITCKLVQEKTTETIKVVETKNQQLPNKAVTVTQASTIKAAHSKSFTLPSTTETKLTLNNRVTKKIVAREMSMARVEPWLHSIEQKSSVEHQ